jgi:PAS domain S-box-containing protein
MYLTYLSLLGLFIAFNCVLLFIFYRHTQKNIATISLTILLLLLIIWHTPKLLTNGLHLSGATFEMLSRIAALGYIFTPVTILIFVLSFTKLHNVFYKVWFWLLLMIPPIIFLFLSWTTNLVGVHEYASATFYPWGYETPTGLLWPIYIVWYDILIISSITLLIRYYNTKLEKSIKDQTLFFIIAITLPFIITTISVGILPVFGIFVFPFGLILVNLMSVLVIALIYRYGWFEVSPFTILSSINYAIFTVDRNGSILQVNPSAERLLGKQSKKLVNTSIGEVLFIQKEKNKNKNYCMQLLQTALNKGKSITYDSLSVLVARKHQMLQTISVTPIYSQNDVVGASVFLRDVSKERDREKQKDDYFSMLSHELKHPISSIKLYSQLVSAKFPKASEERTMMQKVDVQIDKVTRLINDFFELSRLHNGKLRLEKEIIDVDRFISELIETMKVTYKNRRFKIIGHTSSIVEADRDRVEQVLVNFISNACKFSQEDKDIIIHLSSGRKNIIIGIQDFGKGIDKKHHKKVFEHYYQVGKKNTVHKGLGIGLYLSSAIIKAHGGKIWLDSEIGKGSTFYFSLPKSE